MSFTGGLEQVAKPSLARRGRGGKRV